MHKHCQACISPKQYLYAYYLYIKISNSRGHAIIYITKIDLNTEVTGLHTYPQIQRLCLAQGFISKLVHINWKGQLTFNAHNIILKDIQLPHTVPINSSLASKIQHILDEEGQLTYELLIRSENEDEYATQIPASSNDNMSTHSQNTPIADRSSTPVMI